MVTEHKNKKRRIEMNTLDTAHTVTRTPFGRTSCGILAAVLIASLLYAYSYAQGSNHGQGDNHGQRDNQGQGDNDGRVEVCHKGKRTLEVSGAALDAHLAHGDTLGSCSFGETNGIDCYVGDISGVFLAEGKPIHCELSELQISPQDLLAEANLLAADAGADPLSEHTTIWVQAWASESDYSQTATTIHDLDATDLLVGNDGFAFKLSALTSHSDDLIVRTSAGSGILINNDDYYYAPRNDIIGRNDSFAAAPTSSDMLAPASIPSHLNPDQGPLVMVTFNPSRSKIYPFRITVRDGVTGAVVETNEMVEVYKDWVYKGKLKYNELIAVGTQTILALNIDGTSPTEGISLAINAGIWYQFDRWEGDLVQQGFRLAADNTFNENEGIDAYIVPGWTGDAY